MYVFECLSRNQSLIRSLFEVAPFLHVPNRTPLDQCDETKELYEEIFSIERKKRPTRFNFNARRCNADDCSDTGEQQPSR